MPQERRLTAIMFTDLVGYTTIMGRDGVEARALVERSRAQIRRFVEQFEGQWLGEPGDATLSAFSSAINAVDCALAIQDSLSEESEMRLRIGLHLGDVVFADGHAYGDGVNVAEMLEPLAKPGGIVVSETIRDAIRGHAQVRTRYLGRKRLKNVEERLRVYRLEDSARPPARVQFDARAHRLGVAVVGVILLLASVGWLAAQYFQDVPPAGTQMTAIAVTPFVNIGGNLENEYLSDGLTSELINTLAGIEGLRVSSRTAAFAFEGEQASVKEIAQKLSVDKVLEGSVQKSEDEVRINVQLVDGKSGYVLWQQGYRRTLDDILKLQSEIATDVADQLDLVFNATADDMQLARSTQSVPAYNFLLQGLEYLRRPANEDNLDYAESLFREALKLYPDYARAYAGLCKVALARYQLNNAPSYVEQAETNCKRALKLEDSLDTVRIALGDLYRATGRLEQAAQAYRRVIESSVRPAAALVGLGKTLEAQNKFAAAEAAYRKAIGLQPGDWKSLMALGRFLYWQGRYGEAEQILTRVVALTPDNQKALTDLASTYGILGNNEAAVKLYKRANAISPTRSSYLNLGITQTVLGQDDAAIESLRQAVELGPEDHWSRGSLADALKRAGKDQEAREVTKKAAELAEHLLRSNPKDWSTMGALATYLADLRERERAVELVRAAMAGDPDNFEVTWHAAHVFGTLGLWDQALKMLERAITQGYPTTMIAQESWLDPIRDDPRFQALLARYDLPVAVKNEGGE